ncbi:MAG: ABC transporter substrate-binding protein [Propionibacteriales bacterium]|nr:ABC transporter substrate-binding protein [Propionibacteriales bacterium]
MKRLPGLPHVAVAAVSALLLASCGSGDTSTEPKAGGSECDTGPAPETSAAAPPPKTVKSTSEDALTIGSLLPATGDLAFLGPPEFAGVDLAVDDINAAGGVLGKDVEHVEADSGDGTPAIAPTSVDKLLNANADVIVGAASSSVSLSVIDKIVNAGVVQFSPANTSTAFDTYDDKGLYFRTAPSDVLQGAVMANLVGEDGNQNVAILARQDSYGEALADQVDKGLKSAGVTVAAKTLYSADATNYTAEVNEIAATKPDAIVLIAFNETTKIIPELIAKGIGPDDVQIYFVDGNTADYCEDFDPGTLDGVKATFPGAELTGDFKNRLLQADPDLSEFTYGPESYDATVMAALAAVAANSSDGVKIGGELVNISEGGEKCMSFEDCVKLLDENKDIDYDGVSGPVDLNDTGSPSKATIGIFQYGEDNRYKPLDYVTGEI